MCFGYPLVLLLPKPKIIWLSNNPCNWILNTLFESYCHRYIEMSLSLIKKLFKMEDKEKSDE